MKNSTIVLMKANYHDLLSNTQSQKGISLITLIITIIVIIILAAIVIFTGLNTPDRANFAKFAQEISDFRTAITQDFLERKKDYSIAGQTRTNAQIYYSIATNREIGMNDSTSPAGTINEIGITIYPETLTGNEYYEITNDGYVNGWNNDKSYYMARGANGERHYITDEGEPFILPGYLVEENGESRWYVNERKYYISNTPIMSEGGDVPPETIDFASIMAQAKANRQGDEAIGIGTDGSIVNMDLWLYSIPNGKENEVQLGNRIGSDTSKSYIGQIINGKIEGAVPQYIMPEGSEEFLPVVAMWGTFSFCTNLTTAPEIPSTVTDMSQTFEYCTMLTSAPEIPSSVTNMWRTFTNCTSLTTAPDIPSNVINMCYTFMGCTSLTSVPEITGNVENMSCTFFDCTNLTGNLVINANPTYYDSCLQNASTDATAPLVLSGSSTVLEAIYNTKSENSNIILQQ